MELFNSFKTNKELINQTEFVNVYSVKYEEAIKEANNMKNPNALSIGQKLRIPLN